MTSDSLVHSVAERDFHDGERAMQARSGVTSEAARLKQMLAPALLSRGAVGSLGEQTFAAVTARDEAGRLWIGALRGPRGSLEGSATRLDVHARPDRDGPLGFVPPGSEAAVIAVDFQARRRFGVNGAVDVGAIDFHVRPREAYGSSPYYIQQRAITPADTRHDGVAHVARRSTGLDNEQRDLITNADTFFLGTAHPERGADASHHGGEPGFVRVDGDELWWPDYSGNNMFNSMGNFTVNPEAALLFVDFETGTALHLSGTATVAWTAVGAAGDDGLTGRRVRFHPDVVIETWEDLMQIGARIPSPHNPPFGSAGAEGNGV